MYQAFDFDQIESKKMAIDKIFQDYLLKIKKLTAEQEQIINDFIKQLEEERIEQIRQKIK